nr:hypothetical protein CFP56_72714 [Quercus suber]
MSDSCKPRNDLYCTSNARMCGGGPLDRWVRSGDPGVADPSRSNLPVRSVHKSSATGDRTSNSHHAPTSVTDHDSRPTSAAEAVEQ